MPYHTQYLHIGLTTLSTVYTGKSMD